MSPWILRPLEAGEAGQAGAPGPGQTGRRCGSGAGAIEIARELIEEVGAEMAEPRLLRAVAAPGR